MAGKKDKKTDLKGIGIKNIDMFFGESHNPFSLEDLNNIFKTSSKHPNRVISRESGWLEFKEKFNFGSMAKYARTMAAFANAKGGYIVFGVKNDPRKMIGMDEDMFNSIDPQKLTEILNDLFSPEIHWGTHIYEFNGKSFGVIYTHESKFKPVVAKKGGGEVKEAEIYYRYRGRTEKIKYPELINILDERRRQEQLTWMKHIKKISKTGVENAAIMDITSGEVTGASGKFLIDENILSKVKFIKEGHFSKVDDSPAIKLIGDVQPIGSDLILPVKKVFQTRTIGIRTDDIVLEFLNQHKVDNPIEYIKQICWETSANLPVYYYIAQTKLTVLQIIGILEEVKSRSPSQARLMERLSETKDFSESIRYTGSKAAKQKSFYKKLVQKKKVDIDLSLPELRYMIQSIRTLKKAELDKTYVLNLLKKLFENYYTFKTYDIADDLRRTICHLDFVLYHDKVR